MTQGFVMWDSFPHDDHPEIVPRESEESIPSDDDEMDDELSDNSADDVEDEEDEEDDDEDLADPAS